MDCLHPALSQLLSVEATLSPYLTQFKHKHLTSKRHFWPWLVFYTKVLLWYFTAHETTAFTSSWSLMRRALSQSSSFRIKYISSQR